MRALKILGIVFGIILLLTGGSLLAGSGLAGKGNNLISSELAKQGLVGPSEGTVTKIVDAQSKVYAVSFTDAQGTARSVKAFSSLPQASKVGDTVQVFYQKSNPETAVIANIPGAGQLGGIGSSLRIGGIICMILGGLMLVGGILGLTLGKKRPISAPAANGPGVAHPGQQPPGQQYPPQSGPQGGHQYPEQGGQQYGPQDGQQYGPQYGQQHPQQSGDRGPAQNPDGTER